MAVVLAIAILVVNLGILWCLQWMPRKDRQSANQTTVSGKFGDFGGSVVVAAVGAVGSFLSTLGATVAAVVILGRFS
jgi:ABC-type Fe3+ transport system permease subunit